jgi:Type II restriction endonuclease EcoO109I
VSQPPDRAHLIEQVQTSLGIPSAAAAAVVHSFDSIVAAPLQGNLSTKRGLDLAKRNPMIYTARGTTTVDEWVRRALDDWETSAIEGHLGTWMEEVARIVSGGVKPGSGVDLQIERPGNPPVIELYAIQAAPNTKSAGGSRSDVDALRRAAAVLRSPRRHVELYVGVLHGRRESAALRAEPSIIRLGSDAFWEKVSGIPDFRVRLLTVSTLLASLVTGRASAEVARISAEARAIFGDGAGNLRLDVLANPPRGQRARPAAR